MLAKVGSALTGGCQQEWFHMGGQGQNDALNPECSLEATWLGIVSGVSALSACV